MHLYAAEYTLHTDDIVAVRYQAKMEIGMKKFLTAGMQQTLLDKHYLRKHGSNAYYGQKA